MVRASILLAAFLLDCILGDPYTLPHPIRWIGTLISKVEKFLRPRFPKTQKGEEMGGIVTVFVVLLISFACTVVLLYIAKWAHFLLYWLLSVLICYYMLAARSLERESRKVYHALKTGTLEQARYAVSMIVGRDTASLDEEGVTRAAVETVAENTSDGVIAPLLYMALFGPIGGVLYKTVNTMDSMMGYHNEKYEYWGKTAAKLDDIVNFVPARLSGVFMCLAAAFVKEDSREAWRIFCRDRLNHKSPNSAHTEAACAGALHIQLGGSNYYFGQLVKKPTIGDALRPIEVEDIPRSNRLMYATAILTLFLCCILTFFW
jgi:adenosylcobinamide-phosphate synthase